MGIELQRDQIKEAIVLLEERKNVVLHHPQEFGFPFRLDVQLANAGKHKIGSSGTRVHGFRRAVVGLCHSQLCACSVLRWFRVLRSSTVHPTSAILYSAWVVQTLRVGRTGLRNASRSCPRSYPAAVLLRRWATAVNERASLCRPRCARQASVPIFLFELCRCGDAWHASV